MLDLLIAPEVMEVVEALVSEGSVQSVWLIGSRANSSTHAKSDWDLIAFDEEEKGPVDRSVPGVDVLRVRPSGLALVDGAHATLAQDFSNWRWSLCSVEEATYAAKKWNHSWDEDEEDPDRLDEPLQVSYTTKRALLLWSRDSGFQLQR